MVISTQILLSTIFTATTTATATATTIATVGTTTSSTTAATAATAGALNWVMKDGIGQLGGIIVASQMGHYHAFDKNPKRYRMYSAMLLDLAALIEICTPLLCIAFGPTILHYSPTTMIVLPSACIATICKNIGYIMASASRATLHQSLCIQNINIDNQSTSDNLMCNDNAVKPNEVLTKDSVPLSYHVTGTNNNLADVTAKFASQSMAAGLIGTMMGISFSASTSLWNNSAVVSTVSSLPVMDNQQCYSMLGFMIFVCIHQSCNYFALRHVALHHFNRQRLSILLRHYTNQYKSSIGSNADTLIGTMVVLPPAKVAEQEYFLPKLFYPFRTNATCDKWLTIGCSLTSICPKGLQQLLQLIEVCKDENYIVNIDVDGEEILKHRVQLVFFEQANCTDIIRGMLHAHFLRNLVVKERHFKDAAIENNNSSTDGTGVLQMISKSHEIVRSSFPLLIRQLHDYQWNLQTVSVEEEPNSFRLAIIT